MTQLQETLNTNSIYTFRKLVNKKVTSSLQPGGETLLVIYSRCFPVEQNRI